MKQPWPRVWDYLLIAAVFAILALVPLLQGCTDLPRAWVESDRANYDVLEPQIRVWVAADTTMTATEREDYYGLLDAWGYALRDAERLVYGE